MVAIQERLTQSVKEVIIATPFVGVLGACCGYVYARLADLPARQVAKAYAIWCIAYASIDALAVAFAEKTSSQELIRATVIMISTIFGIQEMRKRGLMGDKLMIFIMLFSAFKIMNCLAEVINSNSNED